MGGKEWEGGDGSEGEIGWKTYGVERRGCGVGSLGCIELPSTGRWTNAAAADVARVMKQGVKTEEFSDAG
jgi:hypothetical protein